MLQSLHIKNLALIEEMEICFGTGLNILSGETGAGKSLILGSVNLAVGGKVAKDFIRKGCEYGLSELCFEIHDKQLQKELNNLGILIEEDQVVLSRRIQQNGRSVCRINSETVSVAKMKEAATYLLNIHGQHECTSLLNRNNHLSILDKYAKQKLGKLKELKSVYKEHQEVIKSLGLESTDDKERERELSFLQFELNEIEEADLQIGEDERLEEVFRRLEHSQKISEAISEVVTWCGNGEKSAIDGIGYSIRSLDTVSKYDSRISEFVQQLSEIEGLLTDFNYQISDYVSGMDSDQGELEEIRSRLNEINHLKSKYGNTIESVLQAKEERQKRIETLLHHEKTMLDLEKKKNSLQEQYFMLAREISEIRIEEARDLSHRITDALRELNFSEVEFSVQIEQTDKITSQGIDEVSFYICTNVGESLKPLDMVASGGELSRIMLAIKTVLAESDRVYTLIFDEIDAGISGRTAQKVGELLKQTSKSNQIICITHLPQIASFAKRHFFIEKVMTDTQTATEIRELSNEDSILELARMLGGAKITPAVLLNAREMKELADQI